MKALSRTGRRRPARAATARAPSPHPESRALGESERAAAREPSDLVASATARAPAPDPEPARPRGARRARRGDNVELRRWWPAADEGAPEPTYADHQRVPHWEIGEDAGHLGPRVRGEASPGSMFPLLRGDGVAADARARARCRSTRNSDDYEEIRPPTFALTETMMSTGHLPKSADDMYAIERDGLWAIPTAEVPLTSMHRGEILDDERLPIAHDARTPRASGARPARPGATRAGCCASTSSTSASCSPTARPTTTRRPSPTSSRAPRRCCASCGCTYRLLDLCCGDLGTSSARTIDLEVYSPGRRPVARGLLGQLVPRLPGAPRQRPLPHAATAPTALVHTVNGSALGWARTWAAIVETLPSRRRDRSSCPGALAPYHRAGAPDSGAGRRRARSGSPRRAPS